MRGMAADWFHNEVEAWNRTTAEWSFEELICAMYRRFIHEVTAQNATDKFWGTIYSKAKGALAFYNDLNWYADRMIACPDDYTFKRKFLLGLPQDLIENLFKSRKVSAEHTPLKVLLHEVKG